MCNMALTYNRVYKQYTKFLKTFRHDKLYIKNKDKTFLFKIARSFLVYYHFQVCLKITNY